MRSSSVARCWFVRSWAVGCASIALPAAVSAQQAFQNAPSQMPANGGATENIDFADVDGDGDRDAILAEGGDGGNDQNNLWINRGFEPGGTIGFFADRTATQLPAVLDTSRDADFVDIDGDGDFDVYISNTSTQQLQSNRFWVNMGGAQGGTPGFFQEQTSTRWKFIGVNDGVSHFSSVAPSHVLGTGGFVDWSCDCVFGDLDNDGDPDLFHSTYGGNFTDAVPSRIFLNDGTGGYEEFNPSGFQLSGSIINSGSPGLWCEGNHSTGTTDTSGASCDIADTPLGAELGDLDGDLDVDVLQGARNQIPRHYRNRLSETGSLAFRDVTFASGYTSSVDTGGNYEQELGDFENDDDLDIYGLNWPGLDDVVIKNGGNGVFGNTVVLAGSFADDNEGDFLDYNNDGRLDIYVTNFSGQDKLYRNDGPPSWGFTHVTSTALPSLQATGLGSDSCDIDHDGDYDMLVGNDGGQPEFLLVNLTQVVDAVAPRLARLEQAADRAPSAVPTVIRVQHYGNASWDVSRYDAVVLEYSTNGGGNWTAVPMLYAGGQIFRGEIPGSLVATIHYRVSATDEHGNTNVSGTLSYVCSGACLSVPVTYCTAGTSTAGCVASMSASGTASATASSGFTLTAGSVQGQRQGLIFYGVSGRHGAPWAPGSSSFLCVKLPVQRTVVQSSGGTAGGCDGQIAIDWNAYMAVRPGALGQPLQSGQVINAQGWYRDPQANALTNLSNGIEFTVCP